MKRHTAEEIIPKLRQAEADLAQGGLGHRADYARWRVDGKHFAALASTKSLLFSSAHRRFRLSDLCWLVSSSRWTASAQANSGCSSAHFFSLRSALLRSRLTRRAASCSAVLG